MTIAFNVPIVGTALPRWEDYSMYLKVTISALALVAVFFVWFTWPISVTPSIGLMLFCFSLFWCRKHWISYALGHGVLLLFLIPLPYFALMVGLWAGLVGIICLIWIGVANAKKIDLPAITATPRYSKSKDQWGSEPATLAINGMPFSHRNGDEIVVELGASNIYED